MIQKKEIEIMKRWLPNGAGEPIVSIKCKTYNHEQYIERAIDSFLAQETCFPFEIVVYDDASTDSTPDIIKRYEKKYPNIMRPLYGKENMYSKRDGSLEKEINKNIRGKYVALCEGDDYWCDGNKLQKQFDFMEDHEECSMCVHNTMYHYTDNIAKDKSFNSWPALHKLTEEEVFFGWHVHTSSYFFRRDKNFYPDIMNGFWSGDYALLTLAIYYGDVYALSEVMSVYRTNVASGVTVQNTRKGYGYFMSCVKARIDYLKRYNKYTNFKFDDIVKARISECTIKSSDCKEELIAAGRQMSKSRYYKKYIADLSLLPYLKARWKYEGYALGYVWLLTVRWKHYQQRIAYTRAKLVHDR